MLRLEVEKISFTGAINQKDAGIVITPVEEEYMAGAYLQITLQIEKQNRDAAAQVYRKYRNPFLETIPGAVSKELLVRDEDVQVLHGFEKAEQAREYLNSALFQNEVVPALKPSLAAAPEIRIYSCM